MSVVSSSMPSSTMTSQDRQDIAQNFLPMPFPLHGSYVSPEAAVQAALHAGLDGAPAGSVAVIVQYKDGSKGYDYVVPNDLSLLQGGLSKVSVDPKSLWQASSSLRQRGGSYVKDKTTREADVQAIVVKTADGWRVCNRPTER